MTATMTLLDPPGRDVPGARHVEVAQIPLPGEQTTDRSAWTAAAAGSSVRRTRLPAARPVAAPGARASGCVASFRRATSPIHSRPSASGWLASVPSARCCPARPTPGLNFTSTWPGRYPRFRSAASVARGDLLGGHHGQLDRRLRLDLRKLGSRHVRARHRRARHDRPRHAPASESARALLCEPACGSAVSHAPTAMHAPNKPILNRVDTRRPCITMLRRELYPVRVLGCSGPRVLGFEPEHLRTRAPDGRAYFSVLG